MKIRQMLFYLFFIVSLFTPTFQNNVYIFKGKRDELISLNNSNNNSWFKIWNGSSSSYGMNIMLDSEENVIVHGFYGNGNILIKYNNFGEQLWNKTYGSIWNFWEFRKGIDITVDSMNNIYLVGFVQGESDWMGDSFLVKFNKNGNIQWEREWGGISKKQADYGVAVAVDSSDSIYIAVNIDLEGSESDFLLLKYNQSGDIQWSQLWERVGWTWIRDIKTDELDNIYLSGSTNSTPNNHDMFLLKYNSSGILQWNKTWGGDLVDHSIKIIFDSLDKIMMLGHTESFGGEETVLMKINSSGSLIWNETLNGDLYSDFALDSADNSYLVRTEEFLVNRSTDIYLAKYNKSGDFESDLIWGTNLTDRHGEIIIDSSNNIYLVGTTGRNLYLVKNPEDYSYLIEKENKIKKVSFGLFFLIFTSIGIIYVIVSILCKTKYNDMN